MRVRSHVDFQDARYSEPLPFRPFDVPLREVLRSDYIEPVARWLLGPNATSLLAIEGNSAWEAALSIRFLIEASDIFSHLDDTRELRRQIESKVLAASRWLLGMKINHDDETFCWEHVTWDTSVIAEALVEVLARYRDRFSPQEQHELEDTIVGSCVWLYEQFSQWETRVKYPFGPADVAQIVNTILVLQQRLPALLIRIRNVSSPAYNYDLPLQIVQYLLRRRTRKRFITSDMEGSVDAESCWWDDYFSTAEVIEALARFHQAGRSSGDEAWLAVADEVRLCLVEACAFLEHMQLDGMWGNHIDTLRILSAYVMTRRLLPQDAEGRDGPILYPEIHITFKALRWICDEKQIFDDGSFLHSLFLTVFYAMSLVEVYKSWEPACYTIDRLYDDVVWSSPVRTTPERTRRLAADLSNATLRQQLDQATSKVHDLERQIQTTRSDRRRAMTIIGVVLIMILAAFLFASDRSLVKLTIKITSTADFLSLAALLLSAIIVIIGAIWNFPRTGSSRQPQS